MQQLIINILGKSSLTSLSDIAACISQHHCNILDSRHAQFGTDFSLTLIVSGSQSAITTMELELSRLCVAHDLLSMMKRTSGHQKQNIEMLIGLSFSGIDATGLMHCVISLLAAYKVSVNALRQKTKPLNGQIVLECKMILSAPKSIDLDVFDAHLKSLLDGLGLHGKITHTTNKEDYEYTESW